MSMTYHGTTEVPAAPGQCPVSHEEIDLFAAGSQEWWFEAYRVLQEECPVVRLPGEGREPGTDAFILTRYEDIARVARDRSLVLGREDQAMQGNGNSPLQEAVFEEAGFGEAFNAQRDLRSSDDQAMRYRRAVTDPWVGPEGAQRHQAMAERAAHALIDNWIEDGEVDSEEELVAKFCEIRDRHDEREGNAC